MKTTRLLQSICILVLALVNLQSQLLIRRQRKTIEEQLHMIEKSLAIANSCVGKQSRIGWVYNSRRKLEVVDAESAPLEHPAYR